MIPPLLSQNSRQLLKRFFAREGRMAAVQASASGAAPSTSPSTSANTTEAPQQQLTWTSSNNPFSNKLVKNARGYKKYHKARYSPRRQKQLFRAMEIVKLQEELFKPVVIEELTSSSSEGVSVTKSNVELENAFALPSHWVLPPSQKAKSIPSFFDDVLSASNTASSSSSSSSAAAEVRYTASDAVKRGPYKGRKNGAFKTHKWERQRESILAERKEKLESMPERIAEYTKVRSCSSAMIGRVDAACVGLLMADFVGLCDAHHRLARHQDRTQSHHFHSSGRPFG